MERVVYLLGAGFSAPAGLPVMAQFYKRSKDMFASEPEKHKHFEAVFAKVDHMHRAKTFYNCDLLNIEEILSILEMDEGINSNSVADFRRYICDVVKHCTPEIPPVIVQSSSWFRNSNFGNYPWDFYGPFVANLLNLALVDDGTEANPIPRHQVRPGNVSYGIISLNYDLLIENVCSFIKMNYRTDPVSELKLDKVFKSGVSDDRRTLPIAKLHGCASTADIVAPTWNKHLRENMRAIWKAAHILLQQANHLRIIGYSLPTSDAYVKYLLKSAVINNRNLKSIDVICLDKKGHARERYNEFICYNDYRFANGNTNDYLERVRFARSENDRARLVAYNGLEERHEEYMLRAN